MNQNAYIDPQRAAQVPLVVRVRLLAQLGGNKFAFARVRVLEVLKNTSDRTIGEELDVAYYSWAPGVPEGESTLYLEPYNDTPDHPWKLLEGTGERGVSHAQ